MKQIQAAFVFALFALAARTARAQIFPGSRPPPAPGPETCGPDPAEDALDCDLTGPACP